mmetsp:Transcript_36911/g.106485  ORF Transcript_36911/g.106485 Transcript_36911/m.106485 type:complete len:350 (-) Transcript_36911:109-1158(-)
MAAFSSEAVRRRNELGTSRSAPALAMARSLREASLSKKLPAMEYVRHPEEWPHDTLKDRERRSLSVVAAELRAQREEDERGFVAAEEKRQRRYEEKNRERLQAIRQQKIDEQRSEAVRVWQEQQDEIRRVETERQEEQRLLQEAENKRWEAYVENEKQKRLPVECETCSGSGLCRDCSGSGSIEATFLSRAPGHAGQELEFGVKARGCRTCKGCDQGIRGPLNRGSGKCCVCVGAGKFCTGLCSKPLQSRERSAKRAGAMGASRATTANSVLFQGGGASPTSPTSPTDVSARAGTSNAFGMRRRPAEAAPEPGQVLVCGLCRGSLQPSLEEARWLWATKEAKAGTTAYC